MKPERSGASSVGRASSAVPSAHAAGAKPALLDSGRRFPMGAGIFFGLGLGGFFDGIVLHQLLQWHHMLSSAGFPPDTLRNVKINVFWDGLFHSLTYVFVVVG